MVNEEFATAINLLVLLDGMQRHYA